MPSLHRWKNSLNQSLCGVSSNHVSSTPNRASENLPKLSLIRKLKHALHLCLFPVRVFCVFRGFSFTANYAKPKARK
jgi:hypothetical protein